MRARKVVYSTHCKKRMGERCIMEQTILHVMRHPKQMDRMDAKPRRTPPETSFRASRGRVCVWFIVTSNICVVKTVVDDRRTPRQLAAI